MPVIDGFEVSPAVFPVVFLIQHHSIVKLFVAEKIDGNICRMSYTARAVIYPDFSYGI